MAVALLAGACANTPEVTQCPESRPQICTMEYNPACGQLIAGGARDYSSPCNACADDTVAAYTEGACPEVE